MIDKRKIIQLATAILYNCNFKGFKNATIYTGKMKNVCVPGLNCYSCPGAIASCPIGALQSSIMNSYGAKGILNKIPLYVIGLIVLFGVIFGRVVCGFLCPFGLIQELIYKIKTPKIKKNNVTRKLSIVKYIVLFIFVLIIPITLNYPGFCKYICPVGTLEAGVIHLISNERLREIIGLLFNLKLAIAILVVILSLFIYRVFCRFICPFGAIYSFFNKYAIFRLRIDESKCIDCDICTNTCLMDVKKVGDRECIECGECIKKCPKNVIYRLKSFY